MAKRIHNTNAMSYRKCTCKTLHEAIERQHCKCVRTLLATTGDTEESDKQAYFELLLSLVPVHKKCASYLLRNGMERDKYDGYPDSSVSPLAITADKDVDRSAHETCVKLIGGARGMKYCTRILMVAAACELFDGLKYVMEKGGDPTTALHLAVCCSSVNGVRNLIAAGADVNGVQLYKNIRHYVGNSYQVPLHVAAYIGEISCARKNVLIIKDLLRMHARVNERGCFAANAMTTHLWHFLESYRNCGDIPFCVQIFMLLCAAGDQIDGDISVNGKSHGVLDKMWEYVRSRDEQRRQYDTMMKLQRKTAYLDDVARDMLNCINELECSTLCQLVRARIRGHLLQLDKHTNLFVRVQYLGLPSVLCSYMLYHTSIDD